MFTVKFASTDKAAAVKIMRDIYGENPHYWPYGLHAGKFNDLYLVKDANTNNPVGFVGWQEFPEGRRKIGYYAIGVLPEYRQMGAGREAVKQLLMTKAAGVDEVRAMIREGNAPSVALAESLNIPIEKVAGWRDWWRPILTAGATTIGSDAMMYGAHGDYLEGLKHPDAARIGKGVFNVGLGAALGMKGISPEWRSKLMNGLVLKELAFQGIEQAPRLVNSINTAAQASADSATANLVQSDATSRLSKMLPYLAGGALGLGGLGLLLKSRQGPAQGTTVIQQGPASTDPGGKLRVTLPTRNPGDQETQLELPFSPESVNLSTSLQNKLLRDTKRRLLAEVDSRTYRKDTPDNKEKQQVL